MLVYLLQAAQQALAAVRYQGHLQLQTGCLQVLVPLLMGRSQRWRTFSWCTSAACWMM
jgi:hypothetical protein